VAGVSTVAAQGNGKWAGVGRNAAGAPAAGAEPVAAGRRSGATRVTGCALHESIDDPTSRGHAMIFRRFVGNLRKQDWTAVIVELVVVVVGVFIGLQASNWNENRHADAKAAVFTQRLQADLREEAWGYEYEIGYSNEVLANARRAADALSGTRPLPDEALLVAAYRATQFVFNGRRRTTYDELTSTGDIGLIRDAALRDLAMRVYTFPIYDTILEEGTNNAYRKAFRMALPHGVQHAIKMACGDRHLEIGDYQGIAHSLDYPCSPGLSPQVVAASAAVLRGDPRFLELLRLRIADVGTNQDNLTSYYPEIRSGLQAVARAPP
jgi:hypothetical protein